MWLSARLLAAKLDQGRRVWGLAPVDRGRCVGNRVQFPDRWEIHSAGSSEAHSANTTPFLSGLASTSVNRLPAHTLLYWGPKQQSKGAEMKGIGAVFLHRGFDLAGSSSTCEVASYGDD